MDAPAPPFVEHPEIASQTTWPSEVLRAPWDLRLHRIACLTSCGAHLGTILFVALIAWLGWIDRPAQILGRRAVVTMESIAVEGRMEPIVADVDPIELKSEEPLDVSHATEPLKIEVTPDHVRIQEQLYSLKTNDLLPPELEVSPLAAGGAPPPPVMKRLEREPHHTPRKTESHERPVTRAPTEMLAAVSPPSMHAPSDSSAGIEDTPARLAPNNPPPIFPAEAAARGWYGRVELRVTIGPDGFVAKLEIATSSGYPVLDGAAYAAVKRWQFVPGRRLGAAVQSKLRVPIDFLPRN